MSNRRAPLTLSLATAALLLGLSSCSTVTDDIVPAAGTTLAVDSAADSMLAQARSLEASNKDRAALKLYEKTTLTHPLSTAAPKARFAHASLLDRQRKLTDAFDSYQIFIQQFPEDAQYSSALSRQAQVANAAAEGKIGTRTFGIKSKYETAKITSMLEKVRDNAPAAPSAPKAQFTIGKVLQEDKKGRQAVAAYQKLVNEYPEHALAPEAQYRIGQSLIYASEKGNQDLSNLDAARRAYEDLIQSYPNSPQATKAKTALTKLGGQNLQRSYDVAQFYQKKGQNNSAVFYYKEVLETAPPSSAIYKEATKQLRILRPQ